MLENVLSSGVAFSHDPNTCSPYRVVNWSEGSDTTAVTGGVGGSSSSSSSSSCCSSSCSSEVTQSQQTNLTHSPTYQITNVPVILFQVRGKKT